MSFKTPLLTPKCKK